MKMSRVGISTLSDELLLEIFAHLSRREVIVAGRVCKRWLNVSYDVKLWRKVMLSEEGYITGVLEHVLKRNVRELTLVSTGGTREKLFFKKPLCKVEVNADIGYYSLKKLFAHNNIINEVILKVIQRCRDLNTIWLSGPVITNKICHAIAKNTHMEILYVSWPTQAASYIGMLRIASGCQRLRRWGSNFPRPMTTSQISGLIDILSPRMESTNIFFGNKNMTDAHVAALTERCPNLAQLNLKLCESLTEATIDHLKKLQHLKHIDIRFCSSIPLYSLRRLRGMDSLKKLYVGFEADPETQQSKVETIRNMLPNVEIFHDRKPKLRKIQENLF